MSWNVAWAEDQIKNGGRVGPKRVMEQVYKHNDTKDANRRAEKLAGEAVKVWHCRNCSEHGTGCCGSGDIRFNVVGERDWAVKAAQKGQGR